MNFSGLKKNRKLDAQSPGFYVWLYFLLIPVFAVAYTFWAPSEFVHANIKFERGYMEEREKSLEGIQDKLSSVFKKLTYNEYGKQTAVYIDLRYLKFDQGAYKYTLFFDCDADSFFCSNELHCSANPIFDNYAINCHGENNDMMEVYFDVNNPYWLKNRGGYQSYIGNERLAKNEHAEIMFHLENNTLVKLSPQPGTFELVDHMQRHTLIEAGLQVTPNFNVFLRMLYFSAVTITTLGFGDIAPISTKARMLVMLESVLGIILIGLFFNSLALARWRAPKSE